MFGLCNELIGGVMECGGTAPLPRDKAQRGLESLEERGRGARASRRVEEDGEKVGRVQTQRAGRTAGVTEEC